MSNPFDVSCRCGKDLEWSFEHTEIKEPSQDDDYYFVECPDCKILNRLELNYYTDEDDDCWDRLLCAFLKFDNNWHTWYEECYHNLNLK